MLIEAVDVDFWREENILTIWQAAFLMNNIEPWDEPISSNAKVPKKVEEMRGRLLADIPHYETGQIFAQQGWSCKMQRPAQLSGYYFSREALIEWANDNFSVPKIPLFIVK
ncbi:MAG: hypothetical protein AB1Y26_01360 [Cycloclasticus sp.]